jgi:5'-nucleotidase
MPKTLYIDIDNVLVDFPSAFPLVEPEQLEAFAGHLDDIPGIFSLMQPAAKAVESFEELAAIYDTSILSTSPWDNSSAWSDKLLWVKKHLGKPAYKRLILSHHKHLNIGHFLVDDRTKNGADRFTGEHILFGSERCPDWPTVVHYLRDHAA